MVVCKGRRYLLSTSTKGKNVTRTLIHRRNVTLKLNVEGLLTLQTFETYMSNGKHTTETL